MEADFKITHRNAFPFGLLAKGKRVESISKVLGLDHLFQLLSCS